MKLTLLLLFVLAGSLHAIGQGNTDTMRLTLQQVVEMAKGKSIASRQAVTQRETRYWEWRTYKSNYQPQLSVAGNLPGYSKTFREVLQPNGTIEFQPVRYDNSALSLALSQSIAKTGGTIFATTQMQRFYDFDRKSQLYNGVPYAIGYSHPLWKYNSLKWDQQIEPLKYNESRQAYIESMESIAIKASGYFFELLLAQVNKQIAETNLSNTQNILRIAHEKFDMGKVSRNEILQLQLEQLKAQKAVGIARRDMEIATLNLRSYTGLTNNDQVALALPKATINMQVETDKVVSEAYNNRSDAIAFMRRIAEAKRDVAILTKPWSNDHVLQSLKTLLDLKEKKSEKHSRKQLDSIYNFLNIIGEDQRMLEILETIGRVATTDASVLIMGESGTGKELIAEAIHQNSLRSNKSFIKVNLGGISTSLFESEMFGHVRGAFTDARFDRVGRFELANKGTIFLDEIGDLDSSSQVKLLRVLQDRTYEVLGSSRTKTVDVRVVCATNRNLEEMVGRGTFREDLLYRINLITIHLPALRERPKDIPLLVNFFINNLKEIYNRPDLSVSKDAMKWLQQLPLPGNIRQLKNLVERSVLVSTKDVLDAEDFRSQLELSPARKGTMQLPEVGTITLDELEVKMIKKAMEFHKNRISKAANSLGITRSALYRRLEKYNIPYDETSD